MKRRLALFLLFLLAGVVLGIFVLVASVPIREPRAWGVTFSARAADDFGIPWHEAYRAMLNDLGVRKIRLPVYWSEIEPERGMYNFDRLDQQVRDAAKVNAEIILAIGRKVPRWPECHEPEWVKNLSQEDQQAAQLDMMRTVVERYRSASHLTLWQVENEPFLPFGLCPPLDVEFFEREIALVHSLDPSREVLTTDSGELSLWVRALRRGDVFGTTMYRIIYKEPIGYFTYPVPPSFFRLKRALTEIFAGKRRMMVIELQAEPWGPKPIPQMEIEEQYISFDPDRFRDTIVYASRSGFDEFYLWGVEWWYWLRVKKNEPEMWDIAKELFVR